MAGLVRLMPRYDANWHARATGAGERMKALVTRPGVLTAEERSELLDLQRDMDAALASRFRTTADYRDHYVERARALLEAEGIHMDLPPIADDATLEEIDEVLAMALRAVEVTNSETF